MNKSVCHIFKVEILAACSQITFIIPVTLQVAIDSSKYSEASNVELSIFV